MARWQPVVSMRSVLPGRGFSRLIPKRLGILQRLEKKQGPAKRINILSSSTSEDVDPIAPRYLWDKVLLHIQACSSPGYSLYTPLTVAGWTIRCSYSIHEWSSSQNSSPWSQTQWKDFPFCIRSPTRQNHPCLLRRAQLYSIWRCASIFVTLQWVWAHWGIIRRVLRGWAPFFTLQREITYTEDLPI